MWRVELCSKLIGTISIEINENRLNEVPINDGKIRI